LIGKQHHWDLMANLFVGSQKNLKTDARRIAAGDCKGGLCHQ
jgi:hypothetical protein